MWHEARRSEKKVHDMMDNAKKRAERRAVFLAKRRGDPAQGLRIMGSKCKLHHDVSMYQSTEQQQGMIPWNGKEDNLIDRFDGRSLMDFIREYDPRRFPPREKTDEEEELEERVNFERYRDLIKQRRSGLTDEEGLEDVEAELEAKATAPLPADKQQKAGSSSQPVKSSYAKIGYKYDGDADNNESEGSEEDEDEEEEEEESSEDSEDEEIIAIAKQYGVEDFNRMIFLERKVKEEEKRQKEMAHGDPSTKKLSRKERRRMARQAKDKDYEATMRAIGKFAEPPRERRPSPTYDPYPRISMQRGRSRSRSPPSPARSHRRERDHDRDHDRDRWRDHGRDRDRDRDWDRDYDRDRDRGRDRARQLPKIEFITEIDTAGDKAPAPRGMTPPSSPQRNSTTRPSAGAPGQGLILEALRSDPAASAGPTPLLPTAADRERRPRDARQPGSASSSAAALAKLAKPAAAAAGSKGEKKETPQERLKRIMSKQLSSQIKKDTVQEAAKKADHERRLRERAAATRTQVQARSRSPSPYNYGRSRSRSRSPTRRRYSHSRSPERSRSRSYRRDSRSPSPRHRSRRSPS